MLMVSDLLEFARHRRNLSGAQPTPSLRYGPTTAAPVVVVWNVCWTCNMRCPHCYSSATPHALRDELDTTEAKDVIDQLAAAEVKVLIFSGGEPLMRADLLELISHARARGLQPQLSTNGSLLTGELARKLAHAGIGYVGVSLDGPAHLNDAYRGLDNAHALAVAGLRHARSAGMRTGLRMTLSRRNAAVLDDVLEEATRLGCDRFYLSHLQYTGRGGDMIHEDLSRDEARMALEHVFRLADLRIDSQRRPGFVVGGNDSAGPLFLRWLCRQHGAATASRVAAQLAERGGNSAGEKLLCIDHRGRVHPDQFWRDMELGDLREARFVEILRHPLLLELRRREQHLKGRCQSCSFLETCRGSHRERALAFHGDLWASDPACVLLDDELGTRKELCA